jgi:hypothetical protein
MIAAMIRSIGSNVHTILVQMMTDPNAQTDPFKVWGTFGFLSIVGFMGYAVFKGLPFDPLNYGGALSAYLLAWGGAVMAKGIGKQ